MEMIRATSQLRIMKLYIKYMVSLRGKMIVKDELKNLGLHDTALDLGMS